MKKIKVLFVCIENAGRSQMAEAFFQRYAPKNFVAQSAGTNPSFEVNPGVKQVMKEKRIELKDRKPKSITKEMMETSSKTINMGCMDKEACPALFIKEVDDWNIPDPKGKSLEEVRKIRDEIEEKVKVLLQKLRDTSVE